MAVTPGLVIELMVVALLGVTIGYCIVLDKRLRAVRADETMMRRTVVELSGATDRAERAIEGLRNTLGETDRTLAERLRVAERYTADLEDQIRSGDQVLDRISRIISTAGVTPAVARTLAAAAAQAPGASPPKSSPSAKPPFAASPSAAPRAAYPRYAGCGQGTGCPGAISRRPRVISHETGSPS